MPLGAARLSFLAKTQVVAVAQVIRRKAGVSAEGNAQVDTAQSKFGGSSLLLDGNNDYLQIAKGNESEYAFGTGDWTLEMWIRPATLSGIDLIFDSRTDAGSVNCPVIYSDGGDLFYRIGATTVITGTTSLTTGSWQHIAVARSSGTTTFYLDGSSIGTYSDSTNYTFPQIRLGHWYSTSAGVDGHIDEFRLSNTARYTTNFTPSTTPFVNDDNTLLLLHMDGTDGGTDFLDDNGTGRSPVGVSAIGNAQVDTAQSQFGGASLLLDGTGDYLAVNLEPNTDLNFADDLTVEMWVRFQNVSQTWHMFAAGNDSEYFGMKNNGGGVYSLNTAISNGPNDFFYNLTIPTAPSADTWYHVAMVKNSTGVKAFFNGDELTTVYISSGTFGADKGWNDVSYIGRYVGNLPANGHIDEVRISNTARYTANFTPPTETFVNDANTLLLLHMDGTDGSTTFIDDNGKGRSPVGVSALGNAQIDTAQSQFGGASALFDGTGDYLACYNDINNDGWNPIFRPSDNPTTTIEFWARFNSLATRQQIFGYRNNANTFNGFSIEVRNDSKIYVFRNSFLIISTGTVSTSTWTHIALTFNGNDVKLFINGSLDSSASSSAYSTNSFDNNLYVGWNGYTGLDPFNGHIDEFRISNSVRYTANFTPSTEPFANDANTLLLLHMDGTDASTTFIDDNGTY